MRRNLAILTAVALSAAIMGCSKNNNSPTKQGEGQAGPAWQITFTAHCGEGSNDADCLGKYGFIVTAEKAYQAGPAADGKSLKGELSDADFESINSAYQALLTAATTASTETCALLSEGSEDTITVTQNSSNQVLLQTSNASEAECSEAAWTLHSALRGLAEKYTVQPFPSDCASATADFQALQALVTSCQVDADCAYVDEKFELMANKEGEEPRMLSSESCSKARPVVTANQNLVKAKLAELVEALTKAQNSCGQALAISDCASNADINSSIAPSCQKGVCRVNPAAFQQQAE